MRLWRVVIGCVVLTLFGLTRWVPARADGLSSSGGSLTENPLVIGGVESLAGQQVGLAELSAFHSPEAVAAREASTTAFENLSAAGAAERDQEAFAGLLDEPAGGPPRLPAGESLGGFLDAHAADVELGSSYSGVVESSVPMAVERSLGSWSAIDLSPREVGGGVEAASPLVSARLPMRLGGGGAQLPGIGVGVEPVDGISSPLTGEGSVVGSSVFFANTQMDTDTIMKFSTFGVSIDASLRSANSPEELSYALSLPVGARLVQDGDGSGGVMVVEEGVPVLRVPAPRAFDAAGRAVPVSVGVSGDVVTLTVVRQPGAVLYPVEVDPEFNVVTQSQFATADWVHTETEGAGYTFSTFGGYELKIRHSPPYASGVWGDWSMHTNGDSKIYEVGFKDWFSPGYSEGGQEDTYPFFSAWTQIVGGSLPEILLTSKPTIRSGTLCANAECSAAGGAEGDSILFEMEATESSAMVEAKHEPVEFSGSFEGSTSISQPKETHTTVAYSEANEIEYTSGGKVVKTPNVLYNIFPRRWLGPHTGAFEFKAHDVGLGVAQANTEVYRGSSWGTVQSWNYLSGSPGGCFGVQCPAEQHQVVTYNTGFPDGEDKVRVGADDPMEHTWSYEHGEGEQTLRVDSQSPYSLLVSGIASKEGQYEISEVEAHLKLEATDGVSPVPSSGVRSMELYIDGRQVGKPEGSCSPGPCTASAEWAINGAELGAGEHTLTVVATDNADNVAQRELVLNVHQASPLAVGPGSVNPESGDFALENTDVQMSGGTGALMVSRHYDSRNPAEGAGGPLGPQWTISLGSLASLEVLPDGSVMVVGPDGLTHFSKKTGGGFEAPAGDTSLTLQAVEKEVEKVEKITEYVLANPSNGTATRFTLPEGASSWMPTVSEGPVATDTTTDEYKTMEPEAGKKIVQPILEVSPHPTATCAYKKLEKGCRALEFNYAETTTAKGENESEWGDYKGNLTRVYFIAWDPSKDEMTSTTVAQYSYDNKGRLRAEWDPRLSTPLKTFYGYDGEGHLTAITPPGRQTLAFTYGEIPGDEHGGRLLKVTHPAASTSLWSGSLPVETSAPVISGGAFVGMRLGVSNGSWSNNPVAYEYQWYSCGSAIPGAVNTNYTVSAKDVGCSIFATVSATNGGGSILAFSQSSSTANYGGEGSLPEYGGEFTSLVKSGTDATTDASGDVWVAESENKILEFSPEGTLIQTFGSSGSGNGQFKHPSGIAVDSSGNVWVSDSENNRIEEFTSYGAFVRAFGTSGTGNGQLKSPQGLTVDTTGNVWVADSGNNRVEEFTSEGSFVKTVGTYGSGNGQLSKPTDVGLTAYTVWVVDSGNGRIEEFTTAGGFMRTANTQLSGPNRLVIGSHEDAVWVTNYSGSVVAFNENGEYKFMFTPSVLSGETWSRTKPIATAINGAEVYVLGETPNTIVKYWLHGSYEPEGLAPTYASKFGSSGTGSGQFKEPNDVATDSKGNVWVADSANNRIQEFSSQGTFIRQFGSEGTGNSQFKYPTGIAIDSSGHVWVSDTNNNRVQEFSSEGAFIRAFGTEGTGNGQFKHPSGISIDASGNAWVVDSLNGRVEKFSSEGTYQTTVGSGQLSEPKGIAINSEGDLWVADTMKYRLAELSTSGTLLSSIGGISGKGNSQFKGAAHLAIGQEGDIWVSDSGNNRVQVFSATGEYKYAFGTEGTGEGQFKAPSGITTHNEHIYIVDEANNRVEKWLATNTGGDGEIRPAQPGSTVEYGAPLAAAGLPTMAAAETEKWAQKIILNTRRRSSLRTSRKSGPRPIISELPSTISTDKHAKSTPYRPTVLSRRPNTMKVMM